MFGRNALEWVLSFSKRDWSEVSWYPSDQMAEEKRSLTAGAVRLMGGVTLAVSNVLGASKICDFLLGAGPLDELLRDVPLLEGTAITLLLVTGSSRGRGVVKSWSRRLVKHEHVGGVTDWHGTIFARRWSVPMLPASVRRNLGHILDHGDRPTPCSEKLDFPHLSPESLLPLHTGALCDVAFPSHSSYTKWGSRPLSPKEIAGAMDLPLWFSTSPLLGAWLVRHSGGHSIPLKPFQTILSLAFADSGEVLPCSPEVEVRSSVNLVEDDFWVESLQRILPGTWVEAGEVSAKALKMDDAAVPTGLWDQRVVLVLPHISRASLAFVRTWSYHLWSVNLAKCFKRFMLETHGAGWEGRLFQLRRLRRLRANAVRPHRGGALTLLSPTRTLGDLQLEEILLPQNS